MQVAIFQTSREKQNSMVVADQDPRERNVQRMRLNGTNHLIPLHFWWINGQNQPCKTERTTKTVQAWSFPLLFSLTVGGSPYYPHQRACE